MKRPLALLALSLLPMTGCSTLTAPPPSEVGFWRGEDSGVDRRELRTLSRAFWDGWIRWHPVEATALGDPETLGRWPSSADSVRGTWQSEVWELRAALALIDRGELSEADRLNAEQLELALRRELVWVDNEFDHWWLDPVEGPQQRFLRAAAVQPARSQRQRAQLLSRWRAFADSIAALERNAREKARGGFVATRGALDRNIRQIDALLSMPTLEHPFLEPACGGGRWIELGPDETLTAVAKRELGDARRQDELVALNRHLLDPEARARGTQVLLPSPTDPLPPAERGEFVAEVRTIIDDRIRPALESWRETMADELFVDAPRDDRPGLLARSGGSGIYADLVEYHTTLPTAPGALSDRALDELEELEAELYDMAARALGVTGRERLQSLLRGDSSRFHPNAAAVEASLEREVARAGTALDRWFLDRPRQALVVTTDERPSDDVAGRVEYRPPAVDASRPGRLLIDAGDERRPTYATAATAFGEGIPGRHFLRGLLRDRSDLPLFRRYAGPDALEEGWVDYAEALAGEMGLYEDDLERVGHLSRAVLRRARAVVDVGLHLEGWSRDDAADFLRRHSLLSAPEVALEVELILGRPGAALATTAAGAAIRDLRAAAEAELGPRFDVRAFHEALAADGPLDLPTLAERVGRWGDFDGRGAIGL